MLRQQRIAVIADRYEEETIDLIARMTVKPGRDRIRAYNRFIARQKRAGLWTKKDCVYLLSAHDSQAARLNLKSSSFTLTAVNSPTFARDRGYTGDGSTSYLGSGYNPTTASGAKFTLNDAHLSVWSLTNQQHAGAALGTTSNGMAFITPRNVSNVMPYRLGQASNASAANTDSSGHLLIVRMTSNSLAAYRNGVSIDTEGTVSSSLANADFDICRAGTSYWSGQVAAAGWGSQLSGAEAAEDYDIHREFMRAVTAN